jgi:two-component system, cell cycle sensor histidine kinase and response regulator CckA
LKEIRRWEALMTRVRMAAVNLALATLSYVIAFPLLTAFVDKSGFFCLIFLAPLVMASLSFGRRAGLWLAAAGAVFNMPVWLIWGDGQPLLLRDTASAVAGIALECMLFVSIVLAADRFVAVKKQLARSLIHENRARKLLEESGRMYRDLIELAPEGIAVIVDGKVAYANSRLLEMNGYSKDKVIGVAIDRFLPHDDVPRTALRYAQRLNGLGQGAFTVRYKKEDGTLRWVSTTGQRIEWEGRPAVIYFITDITERMALEAQLAQSQKMEAIGRLASGVAHDFNNILQVILGTGALMRDHLDDKEALARDADAVDEAATKAAALTQQLLSFSRRKAVNPRVMDLSEVVLQSQRMLNRILGEDIRLVVSVAKGSSCVEADSGQIERIILNLAANARDAMPAGGTLTISVRSLPDHVELVISDTGTGMDEETLLHLFEPFFTTKQHAGGSGLGLSIVYGIVKQSRGNISVESKPGAGSCFTISLPLVAGGVPEQVAGPPPKLRRNTGSILLVEDDDMVRNLVRALLQTGGYEVTEAENGGKALEICRHRTDVFDLLLTDLVMPEMRGTEVAEQLTRMHPGTPVLYMTGHAEGKTVNECGGSTILHKPFSRHELLTSVRKAIQGTS